MTVREFLVAIKIFFVDLFNAIQSFAQQTLDTILNTSISDILSIPAIVGGVLLVMASLNWILKLFDPNPNIQLGSVFGGQATPSLPSNPSRPIHDHHSAYALEGVEPE